MKYTITIQRKTGTNIFESLMVLVTEDNNQFINAIENLRKMFMVNKTYLTSSIHNGEHATRCFIEYDLSKGE